MASLFVLCDDELLAQNRVASSSVSKASFTNRSVNQSEPAPLRDPPEWSQPLINQPQWRKPNLSGQANQNVEPTIVLKRLPEPVRANPISQEHKTYSKPAATKPVVDWSPDRPRTIPVPENRTSVFREKEVGRARPTSGDLAFGDNEPLRTLNAPQASPIDSSPIEPGTLDSTIRPHSPHDGQYNDAGLADDIIKGLRGMRVGPQPPMPTHRTIRSPLAGPSKKHFGARYGEKHPPMSSHRKRKLNPSPTTIPFAKESVGWKAPYSYGYFGATGKRQWSLHHGYRDRHTDWTLR